MTTFVLVPGAGGAGEVYWREVVQRLEARGHTARPVEIPGEDPAFGLPEYAALTDAAIADDREVVLVAQSLGGFTAPMVGAIDRVARIVLVNAMIPLPGETPGEWWTAVGQEEAFTAAAARDGRAGAFDVETVFLHDVPDDVRPAMAAGDRDPADTPFGQPATFTSWPDVPTHVLVGADDRMFPVELQVRVARERLGLEADVVPGGHLVAKSRPDEVADRLLAYAGSPVRFGLGRAAAQAGRIAAGVRDDQLDARTPCADWTVRDLAEHLCFLVRAFTAVARHEPGAGGPGDLPADWRQRVGADLATLASAWREPAAWEGEADAGGMTMARSDIALVALDELVLHGWDLARATGQPFTAAPRDVARCTGFAAAMSTSDATAGRAGLYGPVVQVPDGAAPLDVLLGLAGRDPAVW